MDTPAKSDAPLNILKALSAENVLPVVNILSVGYALTIEHALASPDPSMRCPL